MALPMPPVTDGLVYFADADHHFEVNGAAAAFVTNRVGNTLLSGPSTFATMTAAELATDSGNVAPDNNGHRVFSHVSGEILALYPVMAAETFANPVADSTEILITARTWPQNILWTALNATYDGSSSFPWIEGVAFARIEDGTYFSYNTTYGDPTGVWFTFEPLPSPWAMLTSIRRTTSPGLQFGRDKNPLRPGFDLEAVYLEYPDAMYAAPHGCYAALRYDRAITDAERQQIYDWAASWSAPQSPPTTFAQTLSCATVLLSWDVATHGEVTQAFRWGQDAGSTNLGALTYPYLDTNVPSDTYFYELTFADGETRTTDPAIVPPREPLSVTASDVTDKTVTLTWGASSTSALVYANNVPVAYRVESPFTVAGLSPETDYTFRVETTSLLGATQATTTEAVERQPVFYSMNGQWVEASAVFASSGGAWKVPLEIHGSTGGAWHSAGAPARFLDREITEGGV